MSLVLSTILCAFFKSFEITKDIERNRRFADLLCSTLQLKVQLGSYREAIEDIDTFYSKLNLQSSGVSLSSGNKKYIDYYGPSKGVSKHTCSVSGRPDIRLDFFIERARLIDNGIGVLLIVLIIASFVVLSFIDKMLGNFQDLISKDLIQRFSKELGFHSSAGLYVKKSVFIKFIYGKIDFSSLKIQVEDLKRTISKQSTELIQSKFKESEFLVKLDMNQEFSDQVDVFIHDIQSPIGLIDALTHKIDDKVIQPYLQKARARLGELLSSLAKVQAGYKLNEFSSIKEVVVHNLITEIIEEKKMSLVKENVEILYFPDDECKCAIARLDAGEFKRNFSNIINNSIEAITDQGKVKITLVKTIYDLQIIISDNGRGIPADIIHRLLEKGFSYDKPFGTGLGLYGLKKFIDSIGGHINITSELGLGTSIHLKIPLHSS